MHEGQRRGGVVKVRGRSRKESGRSREWVWFEIWGRDSRFENLEVMDPKISTVEARST